MSDVGEQHLEALLDAALGVSQVNERRARMERLGRGLCRFGLKLSRTTESQAVYRLVVSHMARAVGAQSGALALNIAAEQRLAIVATFGYAEELVTHVRIVPGEGIIGSVFASGRPVLGRAIVGSSPRFHRYRNDSYLALPLRGPEGVLGIVAVTDRPDGSNFVKEDLAILRAYAIPAGLALSTVHVREHLSQFVHLASVDPLTGAFNRRHFNDRLQQELERQRREGGELALLLLDIDDFKQLNDLRGHLHGDRVLREIVDIVRRSVRIFDVCARFGGEEFAVLMPGANPNTAFQIGERIRRNAEVHFGRHLSEFGRAWPTLSVGISTARPGTTGDDLIKEADAALLDAKSSGKNVVRLFADAPSRKSVSR